MLRRRGGKRPFFDAVIITFASKSGPKEPASTERGLFCVPDTAMDGDHARMQDRQQRVSHAAAILAAYGMHAAYCSQP